MSRSWLHADGAEQLLAPAVVASVASDLDWIGRQLFESTLGFVPFPVHHLAVRGGIGTKAVAPGHCKHLNAWAEGELGLFGVPGVGARATDGKPALGRIGHITHAPQDVKIGGNGELHGVGAGGGDRLAAAFLVNDPPVPRDRVAGLSVGAVRVDGTDEGILAHLTLRIAVVIRAGVPVVAALGLPHFALVSAGVAGFSRSFADVPGGTIQIGVAAAFGGLGGVGGVGHVRGLLLIGISGGGGNAFLKGNVALGGDTTVPSWEDTPVFGGARGADETEVVLALALQNRAVELRLVGVVRAVHGLGRFGVVGLSVGDGTTTVLDIAGDADESEQEQGGDENLHEGSMEGEKHEPTSVVRADGRPGFANQSGRCNGQYVGNYIFPTFRDFLYCKEQTLSLMSNVVFHIRV